MPTRTIEVTTTGVAGSAAGSQTSDFVLPPSVLDAIKVDYAGTAPATTDLTISEAEGLGRTLLTLSNNATDGVYYPRHPLHDPAGAVITAQQGPFVVEGRITVAVAQSNALAPAVTVTLQLLEDRQVR